MTVAGLSKVLQEKDKLRQKLAGLRSRKKNLENLTASRPCICRRWEIKRKSTWCKKTVKIPQLNSLFSLMKRNN